MRFQAYGFDHARLAGRRRALPLPADAPDAAHAARPRVLAFIGRHVPSKGIDLLVEAAHLVAQRSPRDSARLRVRVFGREDGANTSSIRRRIAACAAASLAAGVPRADAEALVTLAPEYANPGIVAAVFNHVDGIVVPSTWCVISHIIKWPIRSN